MISYECENCGDSFEIEEFQVVMCPPEHYEYSKCIVCFDKE